MLSTKAGKKETPSAALSGWKLELIVSGGETQWDAKGLLRPLPWEGPSCLISGLPFCRVLPNPAWAGKKNPLSTPALFVQQMAFRFEGLPALFGR